MNAQAETKKARVGLFDKLLLLHFLTIIILFIFVVIAYFKLQTDNFTQAFINNSSIVPELLETTCIDPVVNTIAFDRTSQIIETLYDKHEDIAYIEIYDPTARVIASIGELPEIGLTQEQVGSQIAHHKTDTELINQVLDGENELLIPLYAEGDFLGLVRLGMTKTFLKQQLQSSILYFLGIFLLAISLTSLFYFYFTKRWILKPIVSLGSLMEASRQDDLKQITEEISDYNRYQPKDEIGIMSHAFEKMISSVREYTEEIANAKKELSERELKYRTLMDNQNEAVFLHPVRDEGFSKFTEVNAVALRRYGYSRAEFMRMTPYQIYPLDESQKQNLSQAKQRLLDSGQDTFESIHVKRSGEQFPVEVSATVIDFDDRKFILSTVRDITERKQADEALRLSNEIFQKLTSSANDGIIQIDHQGRVAFWNRGASDIFGYSKDEVIGNNLHELLAPEDSLRSFRDKFPEFQKTGRGDAVGKTMELVAKHKSGQPITVELSLSSFQHEGQMQAMGVVRDITERKRAEAKQKELEGQLRQKYKMEAVGLMAGGIAHDFNNILAIILTNLEIVRRKLDSDNPLITRLEQAHTASMRASDLVKQILAYSRQGEQVLKPVNLAFIVEESLRLLRSTIPASVELLIEIDPDCQDAVIDADSVQIEEVLINLCNNAVYAMHEKGLLKITLVKKHQNPGDVPAAQDLPSGDYFVLQVADTGVGMTAKEIERIFDPFYTTKPVGAGTGMGLAISHGIIKKHKGCLFAESTPDQGSVFSIYLPAVEAIPEGKEDSEETIPMGSERILLVDDEVMLTDSASEFLRDYGYTVTIRNDSRKALELFRSDPEQFDLVITDQTMPNLTGIELSAELLKVAPDLPIILCTGYSTVITEESAEKTGIKAFFLKPLSLPELARTIKSVLGSGGKRAT